MIIFVDTSAIFAGLDKDDIHNQKALNTWDNILSKDNILITTNYVLLESFTLIQRRLGIKAVRVFQEDILPLINIEWIDAEMHRSGVSAFLAASIRNLSLVDCVSFEIIRTLGIKTVFAFDPHFSEQGINCIP
ncbi:MAG: PIN domain-containing protein [Nitrospirae bacterium]|nr:PIN domain-containing protein [Nitrospirota bacterium]